ncbi:MAG: hypothetical protein HC923_11805, partial [Myxococcales bacterium]|nr:hypothetical protein [Myxococcales bacterium]
DGWLSFDPWLLAGGMLAGLGAALVGALGPAVSAFSSDPVVGLRS